MQEAFGVQEILKEFRSCRSTGVQTIACEAGELYANQEV